MLDFHTHILPRIDDGAESVDEAMEMIGAEMRQGVDTIAFTPHFYATRSSPDQLLEKRKAAYDRLLSACESLRERPRFLQGSEVHYFRGIGRSEEITKLQIGDTGVLLLEMPFGEKWDDYVYRDIEELQMNLGLRVVIAHVERYLNRFNMNRKIWKLRNTGALLQCNAEYFLHPATRKRAVQLVKQGDVQLLGSDCHGITTRSPNYGLAAKVIKQALRETEAERFFRFPYKLLGLNDAKLGTE